MDKPLVWSKQSKYANRVTVFDVEKSCVIKFPAERPDGIRVYQLIFEDNTTYVGQTCVKLHERLAGHKRGDSSHGVMKRMHILKYIFLHGIYQDRETAWNVECQLNRELRDQGWEVINKAFTPFGFVGKDRKQWPKIDNKLRCRICLQYKDRQEFYVCKSRSSRRENKCKKCSKNMDKFTYQMLKLGFHRRDNPVFFATFRKQLGQISVEDFDLSTLKKPL